MNQNEALRILGLDEDATKEDIKAAYKESAQILHPDRFASNKKLQDRATEQFKNLQEAYEYLTSGKGKGTSRAASATRSRGYSKADELEARLAGIAAARTQLVAQRDLILDERRNGLIGIGLGAVIALLLRRMPPAVAIGTTAIIWGIVRAIGAHNTLTNLNGHLTALNEEKKKIVEQLEDLE